MEDTGAFDVPFVGTSVAKGDTGTVVAGQWPTGLLQAYLKASPMAVELVFGGLDSSDRTLAQATAFQKEQTWKESVAGHLQSLLGSTGTSHYCKCTYIYLAT